MAITPATKKQVNILIIDDDEDDFFITSEYIKNIAYHYSFTIDWCSDFKQALDKICEGKYHIYFVDFRLGAKTGLELIEEAIGNSCEEPIILLTGKGNQEIDVQAMQVGAVDYLVKSELNTEKLERTIRYALSRYEFIKALKTNEQKFRSIFEKSKDAVFIADEQLFFKDVNEAACNLFEYSCAEMLNKSLYELLADKEDQAVIEAELAAKGEVGDKGLDLLTKSQKEINCVLVISREKDAKGVFYIQGIIHDITSLKKAERATLQAEKLKAAERLVLTLAHEVRNPLNNINLSVEQLHYEMANEEPKVYLDIVTRNSKRIGDLITELLDSSRPTEIEQKRISLQSVMDDTITAASDRINLKRINLQINYYSEVCWVMADAAKLKIAFLNIIINAIEAMEEGEGNLTIQITNEGSSYIVSISDNGNGISEENVKKLFEPYYTSKPNGMGLGLASTLNIIQSHKALIEVESKINQGTTFTITFKKA